MKLIVHGQQAYGKSVLEAILDKGVDEVVAVYSAPDKEGRPLDPLKEFALQKGLPVYQPESYKNPEVWEQLGSHDADLCVMVSRGLMPLSECYLLENAALLHDIGKIGMPDSILHKTGPLTEEEWKLMRTHDRVGAEIICIWTRFS